MQKEKVRKPLFTHSYGEEAYGLVYAGELSGFDVFEIPQYGGEERFFGNYKEFAEAVKISKSFT